VFRPLKNKFIHSIFAALLGVAFLFEFFSLLFPLPQVKPYSVVIEDRNGRFLHAFLASDGVWRFRTTPDEIPERLKRILVEKEDRFFFSHPGINPFAVCRALVDNLSAGRRVSGASTITMQIARMLERRERTYASKAIEMFRALQLELKYSKDELLEIYLSMVPLGGNIEGLKSAALLYYQTPLERLNIAQLFDLVLIPNDPNDLAPDKNPERLLAERKKRALHWIARGFFTREDSVVIWNTAALAAKKPLPKHAPHFSLRLKSQDAQSDKIRSSLDLSVQKSVETLLFNHMRQWKQRGVQNGAVLVIENATKEIVAYVGSADFADSAAQGQVDAVKARRSPGSTLKPLLCALQMERGLMTPRTRLLDTPFDAEGYQAENYDGKYSGLVYADEALRRSLNVPMVRVLHEAGLQPFLEFAVAAGIGSLQGQRSKLGLSVILGGCGVTLEELVGAYAAFPSAGKYAPPRYFHRAGSRPEKGREVFSGSTAYMITEILSGLDRPDLPNNFESSINLPAVAFKTGTSYGRRDAWSIGYSAEYTVGVWVGNVTHRGNPDLTGSHAAAPLLVDIFNAISTQHQKTILEAPKDVGIREVCARSGQLPTAHCDLLVDDIFSRTRTLSRECEVDKEFLVSPDGKTTYCASCLGSHRYKAVSFPDYPPELLSFLEKTGTPYVHAPLHNPLCTRLFEGEGPRIQSPTDEMTYFVLSDRQRLVLQAASGLDVREHFWYVDDRYFGRRKAGEKVFVRLPEGLHALSCQDDKGRISSIHITIKTPL
jgi:penicillin-binding protein 1C